MLPTRLSDRPGSCTFPYLYLPADLSSTANFSNPTPFKSCHTLHSKELCADEIRLLGQNVSTPLYFCSPGRYLYIIGRGLLQVSRHFEPYTIRFLSTS